MSLSKEYLDLEGNSKISENSSMEDVLNKVFDDTWVALKGGYDDSKDCT